MLSFAGVRRLSQAVRFTGKHPSSEMSSLLYAGPHIQTFRFSHFQYHFLHRLHTCTIYTHISSTQTSIQQSEVTHNNTPTMVSLETTLGALLLALCSTTSALTIGITRYQDVNCTQAIGNGRFGELKDDGKCLNWDDELPFVAISFAFKYGWQMFGDSRKPPGSKTGGCVGFLLTLNCG